MRLFWASLLVALTFVAACGGSSLAPAGPVATPADPTPLAKCKVSASHESPLVTEWPASEKARLEALASKQVVAVEYSGCEMRIVDGCQLTGSYAWKQTTLATDTVEISNADELYAKLPLGAVGLEGQLARSGRLAVRTTVAGQLEVNQLPSMALPSEGPCGRVTHVVRAISVGSFRLLSGGAISAGGGVSVGPVGGGAKSEREESTLREAGDPASCNQATADAPHAQCASPIQVFLTPVDRPKTTAQSAALSDERRAKEAGGVYVTFPEREGERWTLYDSKDNVLCELPCSRWVPLASGYYLHRRTDSAKVEVPDRLGNPAGSSATAEYHPERGQPLWGAIAFYGLGVPCAIGGTVVLILGITADSDSTTGSDRKSFYLGASALYLSIAAGTAAYYWIFTDWPRFQTETQGSAPQGKRQTQPTLMWGPTGVMGRF